jgi:YegS/Rv2252/BmrU family lipid kinase
LNVKKVLVILNPAARSERARALRTDIEALSPRVVVRSTSRRGHARDLAALGASEGFAAIVAAGGDGTANEVASGIAGTGIPMGILPVGTMNVFASELGIPQNNLPAAWEIIQSGRVHERDLPMANASYFVQLAGVGLDAEVVRQTSLESKKSLGPLSYLLTLAQVAAAPPPTVILDPVDGPRRDGQFLLIGNGRLYGGPFVVFKKASPQDGLLDVLVFKNQSHWDVIRYLQAIAFGNHSDLPDVEYFQTAGVAVHSPATVPVELDGELAGQLPCTFGFSPHRLLVLAPPPGGQSGSLIGKGAAIR